LAIGLSPPPLHGRRTKPVVEIDGKAQQGFIPSNKASTSVTVAEGQTAKVEYETSWFFLLPGKISVTA
jgi:hypothetical protein